MFERFTNHARRIVVLAQEEAVDLDHRYIGTEHLLLGVIAEPEAAGAKVLEGLGVPLVALREQILEIIPRGEQVPVGHIPFTPGAKKALELALTESVQMGHEHIGTEDVLLGLIREREGVAAQVLLLRGLDLNRVRLHVAQQAPENPSEPAA